MEEAIAETPERNGEKTSDAEGMEIVPDLAEIEIEPCRLCDNVAEKMFNIFDDNPEGYQLIGLIKENLPIVLYKTDPLSKRVCEKCVLSLQMISSLKKQSRMTQEKYVEKLKTESDTTDKNILLFLGCTGSKLIDKTDDEEEEEEEELKDQATSTDDLAILCANCKTEILDAAAVNRDDELPLDLHEVVKESLKINRVPTGDDMMQYDETSDLETSDSTESRPAKRRKLDKSSQEIQAEIDEELAKRRSKLQTSDEESNDKVNDSDGDSEQASEDSGNDAKREEEEEAERIAEAKKLAEELFIQEPDFTYEPLSLLQLVLNRINTQNIPGFKAEPYEKKSSKCKCKVCNEEFKNVKLLSLHEPVHMEVDLKERIDNATLSNKGQPFAEVRNKWKANSDENESEDDVDDDDEDDDDDENGSNDTDIPEQKEEEEEPALLVENIGKSTSLNKKDEISLVDMKPTVNGVYLGDYTKEERKAFYQCMRIGGQTKRFCPLCRYCFKDNWAIESHYFSFACYYTCRFCGMRFNKQRHRFDEHNNEHEKRKDKLSSKIYTASKVNNTLPKVIQPDRVKRVVPGEPEKPREIRLEDYSTPPVITKGGFDQRNRHSNSSTTLQNIKIKEEPKDYNIPQTNSKGQNQAYFCRKCYKVFFKLDEFNAHSKSCDYNCYGPNRSSSSGQNSPNPGGKPPVIKVKQEPGVEKRFNGDVSNAGRPVRNCVRDIGPYKDEVYIPKQILNETVSSGPAQSFICHICNTPFPTIYSRNSHMRIHKGEGLPNGPGPSQQMAAQQNILKQRLQQNYQMQRVAMQQQRHMIRQRQMQQRVQQQQQNNYAQFEGVRVKEEPVDSFEPMVEIHEGPEQSPSPPQNYDSPPPTIIPRELGGGAVSLTPIAKKPALNPSILKLVENNPNISLVSRKQSPQQRPSASTDGGRAHGGNIKNAGGYQGPYAPGNQARELNGTSPTKYITVSPNLMPTDDNKSYKCSSCWEAFSNKSHLYFHKKNQCEGSRFPCPFCKKRFGTEAAYSSHIFYSHPE